MIVCREVDRSAVRAPLRVASASILRRGQVATTVSSGRCDPDVSVFRDTVYRRNFPSGGGVGDPFAVRRPRRLVFATARLSDLAHLSLQVNRKNIRVVEGIGIRFVIREKSDFVAAGAE